MGIRWQFLNCVEVCAITKANERTAQGFLYFYKEVVEYVPESQTVIQQNYFKILCCLREAVRCKQPDMCSTGQ